MSAKDQVQSDAVSILAGGVAFFAVIAIFPAMVALLSIDGPGTKGQDLSPRPATPSIPTSNSADEPAVDTEHPIDVDRPPVQRHERDLGF